MSRYTENVKNQFPWGGWCFLVPRNPSLCRSRDYVFHAFDRPQAYLDLVKKWGWKSFTIIYESNDGLIRLQELLKARNSALAAYPITVRQLGSGRDHRWGCVAETLRFSRLLKSWYIHIFFFFIWRDGRFCGRRINLNVFNGFYVSNIMLKNYEDYNGRVGNEIGYPSDILCYKYHLTIAYIG